MASKTVLRIKVDQKTTTITEDEIMTQILATHARNGVQVDVKSLFAVTENILVRATMIADTVTTGTGAHMETVEDKNPQPSFNAPSVLLEDISREMGCKALHNENAHAATLSLLKMLSSYSWDAKALLTLASFAVKYGDFWLLAQIHTSDQLAKSLAFMQRVPVILHPSGSLKHTIISLNNLVKAVLEVARCILQIEKLSIKYTTKDVPALSVALSRIPVSVYWTIMTIVSCASLISTLTTLGDEHQAPELSTFSHMISNIYTGLKRELDFCYEQIEEMRIYQMLVKLHAHPTDNVEVLNALIYFKEEARPSAHGHTKKLFKELFYGSVSVQEEPQLLLYSSTKRMQATVGELRRKNVLLLISGVDISEDELSIIRRTYEESRQKAGREKFEIVWIPIEERWTEEKQKKFEMVQPKMPWYAVHRPSLYYESAKGRAVTRFIKEEWHFRGKTIVVVLDPQGKVECHNALHMMRIWGSRAFPFNNTREEQLWKEQRWGSELLLEGIHPKLPSWIKEGRYILLYGGSDLKWVHEFEEKVKAVASDAQLSLEMINVGKNSKGERDTGILQTFWSRVESLLFSKIQRHTHEEQDGIMQEIQKIVNYNKSGCWAMFCKGSRIMINAHGSVILSALWQYDMWKKHVTSKGFDAALQEQVEIIHSQDAGHKCRHFYFPSKAGKIPDTISCPDCPRTMEMFITFQCCHTDDDVTTIC